MTEVYIGTQDYPFPYMDESGKLKLLCDDDMYVKLPTQFEGAPEEIQAKVMGLMWRNMPVRGRLNSFLGGLRRRSNNIDSDQKFNITFKNRSRCLYTEGNPGSGKTQKAKAMGKMVTPKGAIYVNCKDLDLKTLVVKTILDTSNIDVEKNAIDARIKMYNKGDESALSAEGIKLLEKMFGDAFSKDENGKISVDWTAAQDNTQFTTSDHDREFVSLLQQFCKKENIDYSAKANSVGFVEKDGPLVVALESGRPIILDEINRAKNQDYLLPYLDFLNGNYDSMTIEAANGRVIELSKKDIPDTFMLEAIGNPETLEMGIKEKMSQPLKDRFLIEYVEDFTAKDFTDMFCSYMTGVPISIVKDSLHISSDKELAQTCMALRTVGLSESEIRAIPDDQKMYIENAAQFLDAAEIVGKSLFELYELKKRCDNSTECEDMALRQHIKEYPFSFRLVEDLVNRMNSYVPERNIKLRMNPFLKIGGELKMPKGRNTLQMRMDNQGEALEQAIMAITKEIFTCADADPKLSAGIMGVAANILAMNGIGEERYTEARALNAKRLKNMFTFSHKKRASEEALNIQELICNMIRENHDVGTKSNNELVDALVIESFIADIRENPADKNKIIGKMYTINTDPNTNNQTPFMENTVVESMNFVPLPDAEHIVPAENVLATLAIDGLSENNMKTIWPSMLTIVGTEKKAMDKDIADVLSGKSEQVNYNAFVMKDKNGKNAVFDIIHLPKTGETLIVGDEIDAITAARLRTKKITFVQRHADKDGKAIQGWLKRLDKNDSELLQAAYKLRNQIVNPHWKLHEHLQKDSAERDMEYLPVVTSYTPKELETAQNGAGHGKVNYNEATKLSVYQILSNMNSRGTK